MNFLKAMNSLTNSFIPTMAESAVVAFDAVPLNAVLDMPDAVQRLMYLMEAAGADDQEQMLTVLQSHSFEAFLRFTSDDGRFKLTDKIAISAAAMLPVNPKSLASLPSDANEAEMMEIKDMFFQADARVTELMTVIKAYQVLSWCMAAVYPEDAAAVSLFYDRIRQARLNEAARAAGAVPVDEAEQLAEEEAGFAEIGEPEALAVPEAMESVSSVPEPSRVGVGLKRSRSEAEEGFGGFGEGPLPTGPRKRATAAGTPPAIRAENTRRAQEAAASVQLPPDIAELPLEQAAAAAAAIPLPPSAPEGRTGVTEFSRTRTAEAGAKARRDAADARRAAGRAAQRDAARTAGVADTNLADAAADIGRPDVPRAGAADLPRRTLAEQITRLPPRGNNRYRNSDAFRAELVATRDEPGCFAKSAATTYDPRLGIIRAKYRPGPKPGSAAAQGSARRIRMMNRIRRGEEVTVEEAVAAGLKQATAERLIARGAQPKPVPPRGARPRRSAEQRKAEVTAISRAAAGFAAGVVVRSGGALGSDPFRLAAKLVRAPSTTDNQRALEYILRRQAAIDARAAARREAGASSAARRLGHVAGGRVIARRKPTISSAASSTLSNLSRRGAL